MKNRVKSTLLTVANVRKFENLKRKRAVMLKRRNIIAADLKSVDVSISKINKEIDASLAKIIKR